MKKLLLILVILPTYILGQTITVNPSTFNEDEQIEIVVSNFDPVAEWGVSDLYLWAWHIDNNDTQINNPTATGANFSDSPETAKFTNNMDGTYSYLLTPTTFYNNTGIKTIGFLVKSQDGSNQTADYLFDVGRLIVNITQPLGNIVLVSSGDDLEVRGNIIYQGTSITNGTFEIFFNNVLEDTVTFGTPTYLGVINNISENGEVRVVGSPQNSTETSEATFQVQLAPTVTNEPLPANVEDGINYSSDNTKVTLVLNAPGKDFIHVAASWNNYTPTNSDVMKRDPATGKFWLEITGLTPQQVETYQYWVYDTTPLTNSPSVVKTADPFSTLVLSPFDDPGIPATTYPNLPPYPAGQEREVTVLQTGQTPYNWQVNNFQKPKIEDLIVYEVLVRDFDSNRNYQDLIDRIDYFKNLNINAIHLMPVQEFEGNESWGYNPSYHMALDKFYGTQDKFKEFVDVCHQNGIAVILDQVLNHAFGRSPFVRMWMTDPDGDGWGDPNSENPYMNVNSRHSFNVGYDFSHTEELPNDPGASSNDDTNPIVNYYTERVIKHWIEEYKIDGFRWDLTKGFTQNCSGGDDGCTNAYQQDRVDILKSYADYAWSIDNTHYTIFEHLGTDNEEQQWANHRIDEGKGIMLWGKMTDRYNELTMGQNGDKNITRMGHNSRGFTGARLLGYPESHDEERLMYKNVTFGQSSNPSHDVKDLNISLSRMSALGAVSVLIPGPKMIWHFSDLGMENSIFTCSNGTVNLPGDSDGNGDCKLDTKPQPQWTNNWLSDALRSQIYNDWARFHELKINEAVFEGNYSITSDGGNFTPRIDVFDTSLPDSELRNVIIYANFDVIDRTINTDFPSGAATTWYDLMDSSGNTTVSNATSTLTIPPGQFRILGNQPSVLSTASQTFQTFKIFPNPSQNSFKINVTVSEVEIFDLTGKRVKVFNGEFERNSIFDISTLNSGVYILRAKNGSRHETSKLVKI